MIRVRSFTHRWLRTIVLAYLLLACVMVSLPCRADYTPETTPRAGEQRLNRFQFFATHNSADRCDAAILSQSPAVDHEIEQNFLFALKVVVEASLAKFEGGGNIVHRSRIVPSLLEQAGSGAQDFLPGIDDSFAGHRVSW